MSAHPHDRDRQAVIDALHSSLLTSGVSQKDFAKAIGTSAPRLSAYLHGNTVPSATLLLRAQRIARALGAAREEQVPTSLDAAHSLRIALRNQGRPSGVLRIALEARDRLRDTLEHRSHLVDAWDAGVSVGDPNWDALLAALVEHEFARAGRPAPTWSQGEALPHEWFPARGRLSEEAVREQTPQWLRDKRISLAESALAVA